MGKSRKHHSKEATRATGRQKHALRDGDPLRDGSARAAHASRRKPHASRRRRAHRKRFATGPRSFVHAAHASRRKQNASRRRRAYRKRFATGAPRFAAEAPRFATGARFATEAKRFATATRAPQALRDGAALVCDSASRRPLGAHIGPAGTNRLRPWRSGTQKSNQRKQRRAVATDAYSKATRFAPRAAGRRKDALRDGHPLRYGGALAAHASRRRRAHR